MSHQYENALVEAQDLIADLQTSNDKLKFQLADLKAQLGHANALCRIRLERISELEAQLEAIGAGGVGPLMGPTINWEAVVNEIRALPTRSTGYPPYQHTPDWIKQRAADIVQRQMGERE